MQADKVISNLLDGW